MLLTPRSSSFAVTATLFVALTACSGSKRSGGLTPPAFTASNFAASSNVNNRFFPLVPGTTHLYHGEDGEDRETIVVEVLTDTRVVLGIACAVVRDRAYSGGLLIEDTRDFYAQDRAGNVWYMGEEVDNYTYDEAGEVASVTHDGAWEAGKDVAGKGFLAQPGHIMPAQPTVGAKYYQEYYRGQAEDTGEIVALDVPIELPDGRTFRCLKTRDGSTLTTDAEFKYFAPGVGKVFEEKIGLDATARLIGTFRPGPESVPSFAAATFSKPTEITNPLWPSEVNKARLHSSTTEDGPETIVVERLDETKTIQGIACAVYRDRVYLDGLLIEDTRDWYAQDDAGNVWYLGEAVDNYHYDDQGELIEITHEGSWEAGKDIASAGFDAVPGYIMTANPKVGESYHQEWYPGAATDMAVVVATGVKIRLDDGREFQDCVQTLDWNPLSPSGVDYKYYAPGHGIVREDVLHDGEQVQYIGAFETGESRAPDFSAAKFTNPTLIDHAHFPLPGNGTWDYAKETSEGREEISVVVQTGTRTVLGIACIEALYTKKLAGLVQEVARDWYAQDDAGNVWYMGEEVDNYHYDATGKLIEITHEGSWEAGKDIASAGHTAKPGFMMSATPVLGRSYYQEFYKTAAEDMGYVVAIGIEIEAGGRTYENCVQTLDWNPLEPDAVEYKYYAPGIGLVMEHHVGDEEEISVLTASSLLK